MKKTLIAAVLGIALAATAAPARAPQKAVKEAIEARCQEFVAAWNKHDFKTMASLWAEDGDLINPFGRVAKGRVAIEKLFMEEQFGVMKGTTYSIEDDSIRTICDDAAIADWSSAVAGMAGPDGQPAPPFKHHVAVVMKKSGGKWWIEAARAAAFIPEPEK